jgi:Leu/Phe-tRNA-protein transferase
VLQACADPRGEHHGTWLGAAMRSAYANLFRAGICHSLEVWRDGVLVGGIYGLALGRCFFGESMFSRVDDGSKLALHALCRQLAAWDYPLLDCQVASPHLLRLGARLLPRARFLAQLRAAVAQPGRSGRWCFDLPMPGDPRHLPREEATA